MRRERDAARASRGLLTIRRVREVDIAIEQVTVIAVLRTVEGQLHRRHADERGIGNRTERIVTVAGIARTVTAGQQAAFDRAQGIVIAVG